MTKYIGFVSEQHTKSVHISEEGEILDDFTGNENQRVSVELLHMREKSKVITCVNVDARNKSKYRTGQNLKKKSHVC